MTATPKFPLGVYVFDPNSTDPSAEAWFENQFNTFTAAMGTRPLYMDAFTDYYVDWSQWVPIQDGLARSWAASPVLAGVTPVMNIPMATNSDWNNADQVFKDIIAGKHDDVFVGLINSWKKVGYVTVDARIGPEMNGTFEPWYMGNDPATVADWTNAFRHIADLVHSVPGIVVRTVWNPADSQLHQPADLLRLPRRQVRRCDRGRHLQRHVPGHALRLAQERRDIRRERAAVVLRPGEPGALLGQPQRDGVEPERLRPRPMGGQAGAGLRRSPQQAARDRRDRRGGQWDLDRPRGRPRLPEMAVQRAEPARGAEGRLRQHLGHQPRRRQLAVHRRHQATGGRGLAAVLRRAGDGREPHLRNAARRGHWAGYTRAHDGGGRFPRRRAVHRQPRRHPAWRRAHHAGVAQPRTGPGLQLQRHLGRRRAARRHGVLPQRRLGRCCVARPQPLRQRHRVRRDGAADQRGARLQRVPDLWGRHRRDLGRLLRFLQHAVRDRPQAGRHHRVRQLEHGP